MIIQAQECTICETLKPLDDFYKDASKPSGYRKECKTCRRDYDRAYQRGFRKALKTNK